MVGFRKERANFGACPAVESPLREFLAVCERKAAHLRFDCWDSRKAYAQLVHAESDKDGHGLRIAGDPAAYAGKPAMLARAFDRLCNQAEQSRIQGINLGSKLRVPAIHGERVLSKIVSPDGKEVHGEIARFIAGDPTAGNMTGGYLFKMWGLPAAAAAITLAARPENRAKVGGIMISAALTAFLTGITEPIEFAFLFVAPILYGIHALLAGAAYFICILLGIRHGFTFSHGLIDYVVLFPKSTNALWLFVLGPIWAASILSSSAFLSGSLT